MNFLITAAMAATLALSGSMAFAQASGAMANDSMSKDAMSKDTMSKGAMSQDAMSKDSMSKDSMKKPHKVNKDAMGMAHGASSPMAQ
jgi:pentapeptide MXKDX repeat protein